MNVITLKIITCHNSQTADKTNSGDEGLGFTAYKLRRRIRLKKTGRPTDAGSDWSRRRPFISLGTRRHQESTTEFKNIAAYKRAPSTKSNRFPDAAQ